MSQMPFNVVRQNINAMTARVCKARPLPIVQSTAGSWTEYKRAKKASQFLEGEEYRQRFFERLRPAWIRDAEVFGTGFLCVRRHRKTIVTERVLPLEILVDEWDAQHGDPRNLYRVRDMDRGVAIKMFAKREGEDGDLIEDKDIKEKLLRASRIVTPGQEDNGQSSTVDRITVVEAWHLCDDVDMHAPTTSEEDKKAHKEECNGRYVIACNTALLCDEAWRRGYFPFPKLDFEPPFGGFYGQGLAEQLEGYQFEINKLEDRAQESFDLAPGGIFVTDGNIPTTHFENGPFPVLKGSPGARIDFFQVQPLHAQFFQRQESLQDHSMRESGQTSFGVAGEKPTGIDSGEGLKQIEDQESGRHVVLYRTDEGACREWGRQVIDCAKEIAEEYGDAEVAVPMSDGMLKLKWSECDLETFEVRVFSGSMLPQQKAARIDTLVDWFDRQIIDRATFLQQLGAVDIQALADVEISGRVLVDEQLECMLFTDSPEDEDEYLAPSPYCSPKWAKKRAMQKRMWAQLRDCPEENLRLLDRFVLDCDTIKDQAEEGAPQPAQPQGPMPPPGMPPGPPGPGMPPPGVPMNGAPPMAPPMPMQGAA